MSRAAARRSSAALLLALTAVEAFAAAPKVRVDPRVELLAVIHSLARESEPGLEGFGFKNQEYSRAARTRFEPYRAHPAVKAYAKAAAAGLDWVDAIFLMLQCSDPPELALVRKNRYAEVSVTKAGGGAAAAALLASMAAFARETGFKTFFDSQAGAFGPMEKGFSSGLSWERTLGILEAYGGLKPKAGFEIVLSPMSDSTGGVNEVDAGGDGRVTSVLGPLDPSGGAPAFDTAGFRWVVWHELDHTLLDPVLEGYFSCMTGSGASGVGRCPGSWQSCIRENVAKGVAGRVWDWAEGNGKARGGALPAHAHGDDVPYLKEIKERLKEFEADRKRWPTLKEFMPRLLDVFGVNAARPCPETNALAVTTGGPPPLAFRLGGSGSAAAEKAKSRAAERYRAGAGDEALEAFAEATRLDPKDPESRYDSGLILVVRGRPEQAAEMQDQAVALARDGKPDMLAEALYARGVVRRSLGRVREAIQDHVEALRAAPPGWLPRLEVERQVQVLRRELPAAR